MRHNAVMHLARLTISNFRRLRHIVLDLQPGLNVLVGPNNVGKTAVIDALRALLAGHDEPYPRLDAEDIHQPKDGSEKANAITFGYVFCDLTLDDEADFLPALKLGSDGNFQAVINIRYGEADKAGRLRVKRWCADHDDIGLTTDMMENLRGVYLPPLRDASLGLKPGRTSQLARLLQLLADDAGRDSIDSALKKLDADLKLHKPIIDTQAAISGRHSTMLGKQLAQALEVGLSASDFQRLSTRLSLLVDKLEIEQNGLGFNNLIFMAVVLSELAKNPEASYRGLIVEEPEAHLHPQLQSILLRYLENVQAVQGEKPVQVFVTSHSPNFASIAKLNTLGCLVDTGTGVEAFFPRTIQFAGGKLEKLERYLDVTRAELFFARRVIFVEGAAELMLFSLLASKANVDLREHAISVISVEGLNFDSFLPLFGEKALKIPVAVITDADPQSVAVEGDEAQAIYPAAADFVVASANTTSMKKREDSLVKVFHGVKTLEYDLALHAENRTPMLATLKELHPKIGAALEIKMNAAATDAEKARILFCGMFERSQNNVQKGRFSQALAQTYSQPGATCKVPDYIRQAIAHVCQDVKSPL
jgi:putative ATP-dependent endonuclease of the OLD family